MACIPQGVQMLPEVKGRGNYINQYILIIIN